MARGRYRYVRCSLWTDGDFLRLSPDARLLYVALSTGTASTFAGISRVYTEALVRETGLTAGELEGAFTELEKIPTPARALVVRDRLNGLVWVRDYLKNDPAREKDPNITNEAHRKGIETMLGDLPKDSLVVKKFRAYYHFTRQAPTPTPTGGPHGGQGEGGEVPTTDFRHARDARKTRTLTSEPGSIESRPRPDQRRC